MFNIRAFFFLGNAKQCGPIIQNHFTRRHLKRAIPTRLLILSYYYEGNVSLRSFRSLHFWGSLHHSWKSLQDCHWWVEMMDYQMDPLKDCHWVEMMDYQMDPLKDCHDTDELNSSKSSFISLVLQMCIHLLRRDLSWVNNRISSLRAWITTHRRRRRK